MPIRKRILGLCLISVVYSGVLLLFCLIKYIDVSSVVRMYFPILLISAAAMLAGWAVFAFCLSGSALIGLAAEFFTATLAPDKFAQNAAFLNAALVIGGAIMGAALQMLIKNNKQ